ncbi:MAG: transglycosylase SLT domain-containing protein, partial [Fusobacteriota bacterium]
MGKVVESIKGFMSIKLGKAGLTLRLSKFSLFIITMLFLILAVVFSQIIINEVSQRNIQIEKHRKKIKELEKKIEKQDEKLEELEEFRKLMDAIKDFSKGKLNKKQRQELAQVITHASSKYKYNWRMILAVALTESSLRPNISSSDPSYGLMQIKYMTGKYAGKKIGVDLKKIDDLFDITTNITIGTYYLFEQILRFQ